MQSITSFLDKFNHLFKKDEDLKNKIYISIKNNTGLELKKDNISIKNGILYLKEKPHFKNEVFMKKDKILRELIGVISDIH